MSEKETGHDADQAAFDRAIKMDKLVDRIKKISNVSSEDANGLNLDVKEEDLDELMAWDNFYGVEDDVKEAAKFLLTMAVERRVGNQIRSAIRSAKTGKIIEIPSKDLDKLVQVSRDKRTVEDLIKEYQGAIKEAESNKARQMAAIGPEQERALAAARAATDRAARREKVRESGEAQLSQPSVEIDEAQVNGDDVPTTAFSRQNISPSGARHSQGDVPTVAMDISQFEKPSWWRKLPIIGGMFKRKSNR